MNWLLFEHTVLYVTELLSVFSGNSSHPHRDHTFSQKQMQQHIKETTSNHIDNSNRQKTHFYHIAQDTKDLFLRSSCEFELVTGIRYRKETMSAESAIHRGDVIHLR